VTQSLKDLLLEPGLRPRVVADCCALIDEEVASKRGFSGLAIKGGYAVFKKVKKGALSSAVNWLLDDFVEVLDEYYRRYEGLKAGRPASYGDYLVANGPQVAESLLKITDRKQEQSTNRAVRGAYKKLRPSASRHTQDALPRVGALVQRYVANAS